MGDDHHVVAQLLDRLELVRAEHEQPGRGCSVLLVDGRELVRTGFRLIPETEHDLRVVGEAGDGAAALHLGEATVKAHLSRTLQKRRLRDRVHAVGFVYEVGLVAPGSGALDISP